MDWYEAEVAGLEREAARRILPECPAVFYGSSSIRMWDTLSQDLASDRVLNRGFGGSTLAACVHFFERVVLPVRPGSLVLYAGDNDLGDGRSVDDVVATFGQCLYKLDLYLGPAPFGFLGIKPSPARWHLLDRIHRVNSSVAGMIRARRSPSLFIDTVNPMLSPDGHPDGNLFLDDGLHLSRRGYNLWTQLIWPHRKLLLIETKPSSNTHTVS